MQIPCMKHYIKATGSVWRVFANNFHHMSDNCQCCGVFRINLIGINNKSNMAGNVSKVRQEAYLTFAAAIFTAAIYQWRNMISLKTINLVISFFCEISV